MIGIHQALDLPQDLALVVAIVSGQAGKQIIVDLAIDIVDVGLLHPLTNVVLIPAQDLNSTGTLALNGRKIFLQRLPQPFKHLGRQRHSGNQVGELLQQPLLPNIGLGARTFEVAAPIVNVLLLLDVADQRASAVAATDQASEQEILVVGAPPWLVATVEHYLDLLVQIEGNQWLVRTLVALAEPLELTGVDS